MTTATARPVDAPAALDRGTALATLAAEWRAANPQTPAEIARFYRESRALGHDLATWHATPARQAWTEMIVHVARESNATFVVDIGCGAGHDLFALRHTFPALRLHGVEPNDHLRECVAAFAPSSSTVAGAPLETADLLLCCDVLEHIVDPDAFLSVIAQRAPLGCLLVETTATDDIANPLHLAANRGWHPGHVLERHGWELIDHANRVRVWRRTAEACASRSSLLLCAYRNVALDTMASILAVVNGAGPLWRLRAKGGDALISRSRAVIVTSWWRETADDVFLMVDDDIVFGPAEADRMAELCRNGYDLICGAYPVRNGAHLACRCTADTGEVAFGPEQPPLEIDYAATGFLAVHRRVIDAMVALLPLCHANQPWSFYPFFQPTVVEHAGAGGHEWLSEDYGFSALARRLGFRVWLDPRAKLTHQGVVPISVANMASMHHAIEQV